MLDWPNLAANGVLVGVLGYFLKKVDKKIDSTADKLEKFPDVLIKKFSDICTERQTSCSRLQETKLGHVKQRQSDFCDKVEQLEERRKEDWREQKAWNARMEERLTHTKGGGR